MTTDNREFAAALAVLDKAWHGYSNAKDVVRRALLLADKVTREPSDRMTLAASTCISIDDVFRAMITQALEELTHAD